MKATGRMLCAAAQALLVGCSSGGSGSRSPDYDYDSMIADEEIGYQVRGFTR